MRIVAIVMVCVAAFALSVAYPRGEPSENDSLRDHGKTLIVSNGCGTCHSIPGVEGAKGLVGPPLDNIGRRIFLAGILRNTPENMAAWIQHPQHYVPGNAMPEMGLTFDEAQAITAYLRTLR
jgi:cytochrome c2